MISYISGTVLDSDEESVVVQTGGLGYRVHVGPHTLSRIPQAGGSVELWCQLVVQESALELYGFETSEALAVFETATTISGIGPKVAVRIAEVGGPDDLRRAVDEEDTALFERIPGVGAKKAKKIIFELSGKLPSDSGGDSSPGESTPEDDAVTALVNLGFSKEDARAAINEVEEQGITGSTEAKVKAALSVLGQ